MTEHCLLTFNTLSLTVKVKIIAVLLSMKLEYLTSIYKDAKVNKLVILLVVLVWMIFQLELISFPVASELWKLDIVRSKYLWKIASEKRIITEFCITYIQRYDECKSLQVQDTSYRRNVLTKRGRSGSAQEVTILRMGKWSNEQDHWLSVCAFIMESASEVTNRHVYLHVPKKFSHLLPLEFQDLTSLHDEEQLRGFFGKVNWFNGLFNGDILVSMLITTLPYDYAWIMEEDVRYIGDWGQLFDKSKVDDRADLVLWRGSILKEADFNNTVWWHKKESYHGAWAGKSLKMRGSPTMGFGMSMRLAKEIYENAVDGTYNDNQEVNLPTTAHEAGFSVKYTSVDEQHQQWETNRQGSANAIYHDYMCTKDYKCDYDYLLHKVYDLRCSALLADLNLSDGVLVRGSNSKAVYVIQNGTKHFIPNTSVFVQHGWDFGDVKVVDPLDIDSIPEGLAVS